jgi:hypothetical protein
MPYNKRRDKQERSGKQMATQSLEEDLRNYGNSSELHPIPRSHIKLKVIGEKMSNHTLLAKPCDQAQTIWILGQGAETATSAMTDLGLEQIILCATDESKYWKDQEDGPGINTFLM